MRSARKIVIPLLAGWDEPKSVVVPGRRLKVTAEMRRVASRIRRAVYERDDYRCQYCGLDLLPVGRDITLDHVVPVSCGGLGTAENLVVSCKPCNVLLANRLFDSFEVKRGWVVDRIERLNCLSADDAD